MHFCAFSHPAVAHMLRSVSARDFIVSFAEEIRDMLASGDFFPSNMLHFFLGDLFRLPGGQSLVYSVVNTLQQVVDSYSWSPTVVLGEIQAIIFLGLALTPPRKSMAFQMNDVIVMAWISDLAGDCREFHQPDVPFRLQLIMRYNVEQMARHNYPKNDITSGKESNRENCGMHMWALEVLTFRGRRDNASQSIRKFTKSATINCLVNILTIPVRNSNQT
jgi:hypothetical protein